MKKILVFSADPGGAECLVPVVSKLSKDIDVLVMGKNTACPVFEKSFISFLRVSDMKFDDIEIKLNNYSIDAILTSASSFPEKDMTEKLLWEWARRKGIPSVAVLDQWQNYTKRFSGIGEQEHLAYLPDAIAVMDDLAKNEMKDNGFPEERLYVTGQPALETFEELMGQTKKANTENRLKMSKRDMAVTFFSQPIRALYGDLFGYNESTVLDDILSALSMSQKEWGITINVFCKLHPKNEIGDFELKRGKYLLEPKFVRDEYSNPELIASSDLVIGMASIMLIHSVIAGTPSICYEPSTKNQQSECMSVRIGAIPSITTRNDLAGLIKRLQEDPIFMKKYLRNQTICVTHKGAARNVAALLESMLGEGRVVG